MVVQSAYLDQREKFLYYFEEDTDLLILLCYHTGRHHNDMYFTSELKQTSKTRMLSSMEDGGQTDRISVLIHAGLRCCHWPLPINEENL